MFSFLKRGQSAVSGSDQAAQDSEADQNQQQPDPSDDDPAVAEHLRSLASEIAEIDAQLFNDTRAVLERRREALVAEQQAIQQRIADEKETAERAIRKRRLRFAEMKGRVAELLEKNDRQPWFDEWTQAIVNELKRLDAAMVDYRELFALQAQMRALVAEDPALADIMPPITVRDDFADMTDFAVKNVESIRDSSRLS